MSRPERRATDGALPWSRRALALALIAGGLACGEPGAAGADAADGAGGDAADAAPADGGDAATGGDGAADGEAADGAGKWWTCPQVSGSEPTRAPGCEAPDDGSYGCKRAWTGLTVGGKPYTCNRCRGGDPVAQGRWRAIDFESEDPTVALPKARREVLVIDGNTWHLRARVGEGAAMEEARVDGWYACSDGAELKSERLIFSTTQVLPAGALGWVAPDVFTGHFLTSGPNLLAFGLYAGFETDWIGDIKYCRIGAVVEGKSCTDPFDSL